VPEAARRKRAAAAAAVADNDDDDRTGRPFVLQALGWSAWDAVAFLAGVAMTGAILVNSLWMQTGKHPAPLFSFKRPDVSTAVTKELMAPSVRTIPIERAPTPSAPPVVRPQPAPPPAAVTPPVPVAPVAAPPATPRTGPQLVMAMQTELARRGFYDGALDGFFGPKTDAAIREFEKAAALKPSTELNNALLQTMMRAPATVRKGATRAPAPAPAAPVRVEPQVVTPPVVPTTPTSRRVVAMQKALAEFGYGQIKPTGTIDAPTRAAIEKFERERRLPITGQPSERLMKELAAVTGRPID
jgi:peptidoglycan hydrolase-like protein with peptidoglycan-binding domain